MKTVIRPLDVAAAIIQNSENPELVSEGLEILKLCAVSHDRHRRALIGEIIGDFTAKIESGGNAEHLLGKFPEWAVSLHDVNIRREFLLSEPEKNGKKIELKSIANSMVGAMAGLIMYVDTLFEMGASELQNSNDWTDKNKLKQLRAILQSAKSSAPLREKVGNFIGANYVFTAYLKDIIANHEKEIDGLDEAAIAKLQKKHWKKLNELKDAAKEIMLSLPEEATI